MGSHLEGQEETLWKVSDQLGLGRWGSEKRESRKMGSAIQGAAVSPEKAVGQARHLRELSRAVALACLYWCGLKTALRKAPTDHLSGGHVSLQNTLSPPRSGDHPVPVRVQCGGGDGRITRGTAHQQGHFYS